MRGMGRGAGALEVGVGLHGALVGLGGLLGEEHVEDTLLERGRACRRCFTRS